MLNSISILGRLTRDPELRHTQSGNAVCTITVAVDRDFQPKDGEKQTDFFDVVLWRHKAEFVSKYFSKGRMICVKGSMQSRKWVDKNENNRISWELQADEVYFGGDKSSSNSGGESYGDAYGDAYGDSYSEPSENSGFSEIEEDGELPF